jgi:protein-S-isoprenylcysteine O-methyltransferase Ste14
MSQDHSQDRGPDVKFPPPVLFVGGLGAGVLLDRYLPGAIRLPAGIMLEFAGVVLGAAGLAMVYTGIITFRRARTAVYPNRPASQVVDHGIYAYTRNPMYVGLTGFYLGGALLLHSLAALLLLPLVVWLVQSLVIVREERHLQAAFPEAYTAYRTRVRRWL